MQIQIQEISHFLQIPGVHARGVFPQKISEREGGKWKQKNTSISPWLILRLQMSYTTDFLTLSYGDYVINMVCLLVKLGTTYLKRVMDEMT